MSRQQWGFMAVMVLGVVAGCAPPEQPECTYATLSGNLMSCDTEADWARTRARFLELRRKGIRGMTRSEHLDFKRASYNLAAKMIEQETLWFTVSGEIVDEEGNPLEDVQMTMTDSWPVPWFVKIAEIRYIDRGTPRWIQGAYSSSKHRRTATVNKTFSASSLGTHSFGVSFEKKGYYSNGVGFSRENRTRSLEERLERRFARDGIEFGGKAADGIRVVLKKRLEETELKFITMKIPIHAGPKLVYAEFGEMLADKGKPRSRKWYDKWVHQLLDEAKPPVDTSTFPAGRLWATLEVDDETGTFKTRPHTVLSHQSRSGGVRSLDLFTKLTLHLSGKNAGFVLHESTSSTEATWRQMRQAPKEGYTASLDIDPSQAIKSSSDWYGVHFYIRTSDGKYGKGRASLYSSKKGLTEKDVVISTYMQPDGSRNVQTNGTPRQ